MSVEIKIKSRSDFSSKENAKKLSKASRSGLRKTMTTLKNDLADQLVAGSDKQISKAGAKKVVRLFFGKGGHEASLVLDSKKGLPLISFKARKVPVSTARGQRTGVSVVLNKARVFVPGGFIARSKKFGRGIFERRGKKQYPISEKFLKINLGDFLPSDQQRRTAMKALEVGPRMIQDAIDKMFGEEK